jgi:hypothetical protein
MEIMGHIKRTRIERRSLINVFLGVFTRQRALWLARRTRDRLGVWRLQHSVLAGRLCYRNTVTNEVSWQMPDDVKFYLPRSLQTKISRVFDFRVLDEFRQFFSLLDVDSSGNLSYEAIQLLLEAMGITISSRILLPKLLKKIDINRNGTVEFDEFCWMMYELQGSAEATERLSSATFGEVQQAVIKGRSSVASSPPSRLSRLFCCFCRSRSVYKLAVAPIETSPASTKNRAVLSPAGEEYKLQQGAVPWLDGMSKSHVAYGSQNRVKKVPVNHAKHCMCGCRAYSIG